MAVSIKNRRDTQPTGRARTAQKPAIQEGGVLCPRAIPFETDLLRLIFNGTAIADLAENDSTSPATNLYVSLHTADPTDAGVQNSSEISYTGYSRVAVARSGAGWTVSGNAVNPAADITFGEMTGGVGGTATHWGVGTSSAGTGYLLYKGAINPNIAVSNGVIPRLTTATEITED